MSELTNETTPVSSLIKRFGPIQIASWRLMMEKHQDFMAQFAEGFRQRHGLTLNEFDALINADPEGPVRHRDLLRSMVLSRSALSRLLGRLETRGLVVQRPDPDDHRGVLVTLTEAGVQVRDEAAATNAEIIMAGFAEVSEAEAEDIFALISKIKPVPVPGPGETPAPGESPGPDGSPGPDEAPGRTS